MVGMDLLHSVSAVQPDAIVLPEDAFDGEPDLPVRLEVAPVCKNSQLASRSTTCTQAALDDMVVDDLEDVMTQTFNSFLSFGQTPPVCDDHLFPPNRLLHEHHNVRMKTFMKANLHSRIGLGRSFETLCCLS